MGRARFEVRILHKAAVLLAGGLLVVSGCQEQDPLSQLSEGARPSQGTSTEEETPPSAENEPAGHEGPASIPPRREYPPNRLAEETNPYLLLHAHDAVDWYPWGEEALAKARDENKPIFLSVGYSSCYWCHVMERESFQDEEIADFLNEHFVCIKVDREERPDIDAMCIASLFQLSQNAGYPASLYLTPEGLPFAGTTYLPARDGDREHLPGFLSILREVERRWREDEQTLRSDAERRANRIASMLNEAILSNNQVGKMPPFRIGTDLRRRTIRDLAASYDPEFGGFYYSPANSNTPKWPTSPWLSFLLWRAATTGDTEPLTMLMGTLSNMARGGIRDHLGGGFHRYSVDRYWHIPHFEKMLYDQGQLAAIYAQAYELTGEEEYRQVTQDICDFVLRDMTSPAGGFYTSLNAETDFIEGNYYRWSQEDLAELLSAEDLELAQTVYGLGGEPNFEGYYVPVIPQPLSEIATNLGLTEDELREQKRGLDAKLLASREQREAPLLDTKILTDWNGLMIRGLAEAGRALEEPRYTEAAARAADFLLTHSRDEEGRLWHTYTAGKASVPGYLNDYAYFIDGLLALHQATGEEKWLTAADELTQKQIELFYDAEFGGFFATSSLHETLIGRAKNFYDQTLPAGNSIAVSNLLYLAEELDRPEYLQQAGETAHAAGVVMMLSPMNSSRMVVEVLRWKDVVDESDAESIETQPASGHLTPSVESLEPAEPEPAAP